MQMFSSTISLTIYETSCQWKRWWNRRNKLWKMCGRVGKVRSQRYLSCELHKWAVPERSHQRSGPDGEVKRKRTKKNQTSPIQRLQRPTLHVDAFLYNDDAIDSLCEEGKMSRNYCMSCGSTKTAPIDFLSHSFSILELKFLFHHALPDLSGKTLLDVGSRLGAVLYAGYVYSSASRLEGVEITAEFCDLQDKIINKYNFSDRIQINRQLSQWVEEIELDTDIFLGPDTDPEALNDIHLYTVL
ncbi:uncharacterized protein LOC142664529 isoform X3 [Rhinoderma darwinii]|uniref:uncharacterized protein LOC142664529 isoform X3 n=1 Tax=Rhinoderma darwinii TaxID=43563 RepID=UPI003F67AC62